MVSKYPSLIHTGTCLDILIGKEPGEIAAKPLEYQNVTDNTLIVTKEETSDGSHQSNGQTDDHQLHLEEDIYDDGDSHSTILEQAKDTRVPLTVRSRWVI